MCYENSNHIKMNKLKVFTGNRDNVKKDMEAWMEQHPNLIDFDILSNLNNGGYVICYLKYEEGMGGL